jgi:hypothetical protein
MNRLTYSLVSAPQVVAFLLVFVFATQVVVFARVGSVSEKSLETVGPMTSNCSETKFSQAPHYETGINPRSGAAADLDGDALVDIATIFSYTTYGVSILRNVGNGKFAPKQDITITGDPPTNIFIHDLNDDGKPEILITYASRAKVSVMKNISPGIGTIAFAPKVDLAISTEQSLRLQVGDLDSDGKPDLAVPGDGKISIFRNASVAGGDIIFEQRTDFVVARVQKSISLGDFDGDSKLDIALAAQSGVSVLRNTSTGPGNLAFTSAYSYITGGATSVISVDLDLDGKLDLVTSTNSNVVTIYRNTSSGSGNFSFAQPLNFSTGLTPIQVVAADFDADGKVDLATSNQSANSVSVLRNISSAVGSFAFAVRSWDFGTGARPDSMFTADFNGDSKADVATANVEDNNVSILVNKTVAGGAIDFGARKDYLTPSQAGVTNLASADFDGDGNLDLAASFEETRNVFIFSVYRNDGTGHFSSRIDVAPTLPPDVTFLEPYFIAAGDFDGDGKPDVAMSGAWNSFKGLRIYRNTSSGPGNFSFVVTDYSSLFEGPQKVFITDLDGDGKSDIVAVSHRIDRQYEENLLLFRNGSSGPGGIAFDPPVDIPLFETGYPFPSGDLNSDNKVDFIHQSNTLYNSPMTVQLNTSQPGQIGFTPQTVQMPGNITHGRVVITDVDGDLKNDLVMNAGNDNGSVYVLRNTSTDNTLTFDSLMVLQNNFLQPILVADFDGEGKTDILTRTSLIGAFALVILTNASSSGSVMLTPGERITVGGNSNMGSLTSTITGDFNNDGKLDIATGFSSTIGTISLLLSETCQTRSAPYDFDGDNKTDIGIFRPSDGSWWYSRSSDNAARVFSFGSSTDILTPGDFTGDGKADVSVFRPADGFWYIQRSEDNSFFSFPFGQAGDIPAPLDYDGDGKTDAAVFRPSSGTWFILNSGGSGTSIVNFGSAEDKPTPADYDGDGKADIAIFRPSDGSWWYLRSSDSQFRVFRFGVSTDKPVPGDYTGDGKADIAVFRPSTGEWFFQRSEDNSYFSVPFGAQGDIPAPGDYDGDGKFDTAVFRPSTANWFVQRSGAGTLITTFGASGDLPIPNVFIP